MVETIHIIFHWLFVSISCILFYYSIRYFLKYKTLAAFILPPFVCICIIFENIIMATMDINEKYTKNPVKIMLIFHAFIFPLLLLICFEIAYLVHKQKSVNFCGIYFEERHRAKRKKILSNFLRFFIWIISITLFILNLIINYNWLGKKNIYNGLYDLKGNISIYIIFSILPTFIVVILSFYIGLQLWNYGTYYSFMVHATCFNPWIWMVVGSIILLIGQLMPNSIYSITSNGSVIIMLGSIIRMFREVHHDLQQGQEIQVFIDPIDTRVHTEIYSPNYQSGPFTPKDNVIKP